MLSVHHNAYGAHHKLILYLFQIQFKFKFSTIQIQYIFFASGVLIIFSAGDVVKKKIKDFLSATSRANLAKQTTVSLIKKKAKEPATLASSDSESEEDGELDEEAQLPVKVVDRCRLSETEAVTAQAFIIEDLGDKGVVNLFRLGPESTSTCVATHLRDTLIEQSTFRLAVADIPYGVTQEEWDLKPWGSEQVMALANWVVKFGTHWNQGNSGFTLVIFCKMEYVFPSPSRFVPHFTIY